MEQLSPKWLRLAHESPQAYEAFELYREQGPKRSIRKTASDLGKARQTLEKWANRHRWLERSRAFDDEQDAIRAKIFHKRRIAAIESQANLGGYMREKAMEGLDTLDTTSMDAGSIARLAEVGVKIERLAYGDSTDNQATAVGVQFVLGELPPWAVTAVTEQKEVIDELEAKRVAQLSIPRSLPAKLQARIAAERG